MVGRRPCEVGIAAVCGAGGFRAPGQGSGAAHEAAEGVWGAAGLDGIPIEVLVRDPRAVAPQGDGTVVLRRWLVTVLGRAGIGLATWWRCRDRVSEFGGTARSFVVAAWRSVCHFGRWAGPCFMRGSGLMRWNSRASPASDWPGGLHGLA